MPVKRIVNALDRLEICIGSVSALVELLKSRPASVSGEGPWSPTPSQPTSPPWSPTPSQPISPQCSPTPSQPTSPPTPSQGRPVSPTQSTAPASSQSGTSQGTSGRPVSPFSTLWITTLKAPPFHNFTGTSTVGPNVPIPDMPLAIFRLFYTPDVIEMIVEQSNNYAKAGDIPLPALR